MPPNPVRRLIPYKVGQRVRLIMRTPLRPFVRVLWWFLYHSYFHEGRPDRLRIGDRCGLANTIFNTASGEITIGDNCAFGYNVMLLTGRHRFTEGRRASLAKATAPKGWGGGSEEVPNSGFDITIEDGCWIASGAIISGGVTIGANSLVCAGAVVTHDAPAYSILAGVPARIVGDTRDL